MLGPNLRGCFRIVRRISDVHFQWDVFDKLSQRLDGAEGIIVMQKPLQKQLISHYYSRNSIKAFLSHGS
jgi:hypothetical protein